MTTKNHRLGLGLCLAALCLGSPARAQTSSEDAKAKLQAIEKELQSEYKDLKQASKEAADDEARSAIYSDFYEHIVPDFARRYAEVARSVKGTDEALTAWTQVVSLAADIHSAELGSEALTAIVADHLQSTQLVNIVNNLRYQAASLGEDVAITALKAIAAGTSLREAKAAALFSLGALLGEERPVGDPKLAEAKVVLAALADFGDVKYMDGRTFADAARMLLFALENLQPGKPCPDFGAVDAEGAGFKLSDYKGKVVLVDFWGFW